MRLNFKKVYEKYIRNHTKRTTCRFGDKTHRYKIGQILELTTGSRYKPETILKAICADVELKRFGNITEADLIWESPDCRTTEGLRCTMFHINGVLLSDTDWITLIHWW